MLDPYDNDVSHITLLEAAQPAAEFRALSFPTMGSPSVFRSDSLQKDSPNHLPAAAIGLLGHSFVSKPFKTRVIVLNGQGQRIDPQLPQFTYQASAQLKKRADLADLCYSYNLTGKCTISDCHYTHQRLAQDQVLVLRHQFRKQMCSEGTECRSFDCYFGHHCPFPICRKPQKCWFGSLHHTDMVKAHEIFESAS